MQMLFALMIWLEVRVVEWRTIRFIPRYTGDQSPLMLIWDKLLLNQKAQGKPHKWELLSLNLEWKRAYLKDLKRAVLWYNRY